MAHIKRTTGSRRQLWHWQHSLFTDSLMRALLWLGTRLVKEREVEWNRVKVKKKRKWIFEMWEMKVEFFFFLFSFRSRFFSQEAAIFMSTFYFKCKKKNIQTRADVFHGSSDFNALQQIPWWKFWNTDRVGWGVGRVGFIYFPKQTSDAGFLTRDASVLTWSRWSDTTAWFRAH